MTEQRRTNYDIALDVMCARCEARPGEPCVTVTGKPATALHEPRMGPIREAYGEGYQDAAEDSR